MNIVIDKKAQEFIKENTSDNAFHIVVKRISGG